MTLLKEHSADCDCTDHVYCMQQIFLELAKKDQQKTSGCPIKRPVFSRLHGVLKGQITFDKQLPENLKVGLFSNQGSYPVHLRYASDVEDNSDDYKSSIGMSLKIYDIPGLKFASLNDSCVDLLFQNTPFYFVDNATEMRDYMKSIATNDISAWQQKFPDKNLLLKKQREQSLYSVFESNLWSVIPFHLGPDNFCKIIVKTNSYPRSKPLDTYNKHYLHNDLISNASLGNIVLDLYVQQRPTAAHFTEEYIDQYFPLDKASVVWDEHVAKPIKVAQIVMEKQEISDLDVQDIYDKGLSFNVGRIPIENKPVGSIAEARIQIYNEIAKERNIYNL